MPILPDLTPPGKSPLDLRWLTDEELRRDRRRLERNVALADVDTRDEYPHLPPDELAALTANAREFHDALLADVLHEERRRALAAARGVPRDGDTFPRAWLDDLKRRADLAAVLEGELGVHLGRPNARGVRRGPCPVCGTSDRSDALTAHLGDTGDQWWHCHACHASGDCITAVQLGRGLTFVEAVRALAALGGVALPQPPRADDAGGEGAAVPAPRPGLSLRYRPPGVR